MIQSPVGGLDWVSVYPGWCEGHMSRACDLLGHETDYLQGSDKKYLMAKYVASNSLSKVLYLVSAGFNLE